VAALPPEPAPADGPAPLRFSDLDGRRIAVWGAGVETRSFARQLAAHLPAARIDWLIIEDDEPGAAPIAVPTTAQEPDLLAGGAQVLRAAEAAATLPGAADVLVRSPGVSLHRPEVLALREAGVPTATATGLWLAERGGRNVIGVTATKGKSTTASLIAHLARAAGATTHLAGNIGDPALDLLGIPEDDLVVLELSSYQIADLTIGPETALAANLYREHLNWHLTEENYRHEKLRLLALPGVRHCVLGAQSEEVMAAPTADGADLTVFGVAPGWQVTDEGVEHGCALMVPAGQLPLPGAHNALNLCGALAALDAHGLARPPLPAALAGFRALPHRLERVHEAGGVLWIDDSISTTTESAVVAIESFPGRPIVLIGGGTDRGQDYTLLGEELAARGAAVVALGPTGPRLLAAAREAGVPEAHAVLADDLDAAVGAARALAAALTVAEAQTSGAPRLEADGAGPAAGAVVLLSPAAPSFHAYRDFKARGEHFRALAQRG
jgi:UDP-N-acetylmuramoylalanine--D-glutamate ligase